MPAREVAIGDVFDELVDVFHYPVLRTCPLAGQQLPLNVTSNSRVRTGAARLPVLHAVDVVVVGGSCSAVAAAVLSAQSGHSVLLIEPRTYLGREITATLRPWLCLDRDAPGQFWDDLLERMGKPRPEEGELALKLDDLKLALEDTCLDAGVEILYASRPVDVFVEANQLAGLVIGNKSGRQVIRTRAVVDASETAVVARLAGASFVPATGTLQYRRTIEFDGLLDDPGRVIDIPPQLGIAGDTVQTHRSYRGERHIYVELALALPFAEGLEACMAREVAARHVSMALALHLIQMVPAFREATLAASSLELAGPQTTRLEATSDPSEPAGPISGLWCLNEAVDPDGTLANPVTGPRIGEAVARAIMAGIRAAPSPQPGATRDSVPDQYLETFTLGEPASPQRGRQYERCEVRDRAFPVLGHCDVLVVGGGAGGASAAITAAREGADTILLEMNPGLGGTGTLGGVHSYWYGRHVGFAASVQRLTDEVQRPLGHTRSTWNIEAKMYALLRAGERAGARIFFNTLTIGALLDRDRVRGVLAATPFGPQVVLAEVVIDATGDGDVAAFAGAPYVYGAALDHTSMWYSLGQFTTPGRTRNNFTSMVDVSNVQDYTRAILAGRRRGHDVHDHSIYLAPRESRHIQGEVTMTHTDQLIKRQWPDVVNIHYSNHDVKGCSTSPWVRAGLIPPNLEIEVPYRALLPRDLNGILLAGKAVSATHDALAAIRMQADMETLGGVTALAACQAIQAGVAPRQIDVPGLQRRLVGEGILPKTVLGRKLDPPTRDPEDLHHLVDELTGEHPLYQYSDMEMGELFEGHIPFVEICLAGPEIVPLLGAALSESTGLRRQHLAQALAMYGCSSAVPVLIACIEEHLKGGRLPIRENQIRHANYPPDQGAMPDVVYLLYSLGMVGDCRAIPVWEMVVHLIEATEDDVRDRRKGTFYYVEAVCWGAGQLRDGRSIPLLQRLHARPALHDNVCTSSYQADFFQERHAMMELMLARALARCGSARGFELLLEYLDDVRAPLAERAHSHLVDLTGKDFGKDAPAWLAGGGFPCRPGRIRQADPS